MRLKNIVKQQLRQGASAKGLATSIAIAVMFGAFPLIGFTTLFCLAAGAAFKLNHPTIQITNYLMAPVQLILMPVFLRLGESIVGAKPIPLNPVQMMSDFYHHTTAFFAQYGAAGAMAVLAWFLLIPWLGLAVYVVAHWLLRRIPIPAEN